MRNHATLDSMMCFLYKVCPYQVPIRKSGILFENPYKSILLVVRKITDNKNHIPRKSITRAVESPDLSNNLKSNGKKTYSVIWAGIYHRRS